MREYTLFLFFVGGYEQSYLSSGLPRAATFQVRTLINEQRLGDVLAKRYPGTHDYATDKALWQYTQDLKNQFLRNAPPINKVMYDNKIHVLKNALGLHTAVSRVQGGKLKAKAEIRVATVFRNAPEPFLRMIVVHELAHLKEKSITKRSINCAAIWSRSTTSLSSTPDCG